MSQVIDARGLGQRYGRKWVLRSLNLTVGTGVTALLGPNGAGKTTLLHTVVGLRRPAAGELGVLGADLTRRNGVRPITGRLGFLAQTVGYYPGYTVYDHVAYAAWLKGVPSRMVDERVRAALAATDLESYERSKVRALSGGLLRRAGIAQAVVAGPELLVLDEPAAGLDPQQRIELRKLVRTLASSTTVLVSTHAVEDIRHMADRVLVLREGKVVFTGTAEALAARGEGAAVDGDNDLERGYLVALGASHRPAGARLSRSHERPRICSALVVDQPTPAADRRTRRSPQPAWSAGFGLVSVTLFGVTIGWIPPSLMMFGAIVLRGGEVDFLPVTWLFEPDGDSAAWVVAGLLLTIGVIALSSRRFNLRSVDE